MNNKHEELNNVIIKVAKYLDGWRFKYNNEHSTFVSIISDHGMQINFDNGAETKKVRVFGSWPKIDNIRIIDHGILRSNESIPSINFNSSRPIKVIANDLIRRFIKYYIPLYMRCIEKKKELLEEISLTKIKINALQKVGEVQRKYNISGVDINPNIVIIVKLF